VQLQVLLATKPHRALGLQVTEHTQAGIVAASLLP
jgi:hypothetical protein